MHRIARMVLRSIAEREILKRKLRKLKRQRNRIARRLYGRRRR